MAGLAGVTALAWVYLLGMAAAMEDPDGAMEDLNGMRQMGDAMTMARTTTWTTSDFFVMFLMWAIMMVGMMLPSAAPMILLFALVNRRKEGRGYAATPTTVFTSGYVAAWTAFSLVATASQWMLQRVGLLSPLTMTTGTVIGGSTLVAAGVYQWTPFKSSCLRHCQSPLQFITHHWRDGTRGAFEMGWHHGLYCLGCCWVLMCLLFVGGVMNLLWVAGLAVFVLVEKVWPRRWVPKVSGAVLVVWGAFILTRGL